MSWKLETINIKICLSTGKKGLCYPISENKGADQLLFSHRQESGFSWHGSTSWKLLINNVCKLSKCAPIVSKCVLEAFKMHIEAVTMRRGSYKTVSGGG